MLPRHVVLKIGPMLQNLPGREDAIWNISGFSLFFEFFRLNFISNYTAASALYSSPASWKSSYSLQSGHIHSPVSPNMGTEVKAWDTELC